MRRGWLVLGIVLALALTGCAEPTDTDEATDGSRCLPFSRATAEEFVTNSDTGQRNVEGEIGDAAAVKSSERVPDDARINAGSDIYFISFEVDDQIVMLSHADNEGAGPTGAGLYAAVDAFSEEATHFPYDPSAPAAEAFHANLDADGAQESRDCLTR